MKSTSDLVFELMERDDQASDMEDCIAEIKTTLESPYITAARKVNLIRKTIQDYDL